MSNMISKELLVPVKRAIGDFNMIEDGDSIAVGVSGGKDSLTCLLALKELQAILPVKYQLHAIAIDLGWINETADWGAIAAFCKSIDVPFHVENTRIAEIIFEARQESNPCSLCSRMRNGALVIKAKALGCNRLALGHHADDANETILMNMFYAGKIKCFSPSAYLDRKEIHIIRPLVYIRESLTIRIAKKLALPVHTKKLCPVDGQTKRESVKKLLADLAQEDREIPVRVLSCLKDYWAKDV